MSEILKQIESFHGHIGPYAVIGYKMGEIALKKFGTDPFRKKAVAWTGTKPPLSCIIDGLQLSSGCTLGKGNLKVLENGEPKVEFENDDGKKMQIILKKNVQEMIDTQVTKENMLTYSEKIFKQPDENLFIFIESKP